MKISCAVEDFLRNCAFGKNLSPLTTRAYRTDLRQFTRTAARLKIENVAEITAAVIQEFIAELQAQRPFRSSSIRRKIAALKAFLHDLERSDAIERNPFANSRFVFRQEKKIPRVLTRAQMESVLAAAQVGPCRKPEPRHGALRDHALLELLFYSGARIGEILKLELDDLDLDAGLVKIKGKGRRERILYIGYGPVTDVLKRYLAARSALGVATGVLFLNNRLRPLSTYSAENIVRKHAAKARLTMRVTPHMFRHTLATMLLENGADLRSIQETLGHASISTTEIYTHVSAERKRRVMQEFHPRQ